MSEKDIYVKLRADFLRICDGNHCAAMVLSQMQCWNRTKIKHKTQSMALNAAAVKDGLAPSQDTGLWVYMSIQEMQVELMGAYGETMVGNAFKLLIDKGFLLQRQNPQYKWDRKKQFLYQESIVDTAISLDVPTVLKSRTASRKNTTSIPPYQGIKAIENTAAIAYNPILECNNVEYSILSREAQKCDNINNSEWASLCDTAPDSDASDCVTYYPEQSGVGAYADSEGNGDSGSLVNIASVHSTDSLMEDMFSSNAKSSSETAPKKRGRPMTPKQGQTAVETNPSAKEGVSSGKVKPKFTPPSLTDVAEYMGAVSKNRPADPMDVAESFVNYYANVGWRVGRNVMIDWHLAASNWLKPKPWQKEVQLTSARKSTIIPPGATYASMAQHELDIMSPEVRAMYEPG